MYCKNCGKNVEQGKKFCKNCGAPIVQTSTTSTPAPSENWLKRNKKILLGAGGVLALLLVILFFSGEDASNSSNNLRLPPITINAAKQQTVDAFRNRADAIFAAQDTVSSFTVNILCPDESGSGGSGGSGTIMTPDGLILTNAHIIPQDENDQPTTPVCVVTLPDSQGKVRAIYTGKPVIVPQYSKLYDLAFVQVDGPYENELGITQGSYPTTFPNFADSGCWNANPRLGEPVRVFGYPAISAGGTYLTITSGEVSSLPDDGTIVTSAKVDHGSSGGIAVDENGCMIGIPTQISGDENESLGVLLSNDTIAGFMDKLSD